MFHFTKKRAVVMAVVGSLALSVGAYAYFTNSGSGSGSAVGGSSSAVTIAQIGEPAALYPGTSSDVVVTTTNAGTGSQHVANVKLASVETGAPDCNPAWFTMPDITVNETLAPGATSNHHPGSLTMANADANQDACQRASLVLHFSSN
jgi:hypothetical protein